jgi:hypothetical protein
MFFEKRGVGEEPLCSQKVFSPTKSSLLVNLVFFEPGHHAAQFFAHLFDLVFGFIAAG